MQYLNDVFLDSVFFLLFIEVIHRCELVLAVSVSNFSLCICDRIFLLLASRLGSSHESQ